MRTGIIVFVATLALSCVLGVAMYYYYQPQLAAVQDLVIGLGYFMEEHGRFPASEAEFTASDFVEKLPNGAIRIKPRMNSVLIRNLHQQPIESLKPFQIAWGTDLNHLQPDTTGALYDAAGNKVELLIWPASPPSGKMYSLTIMEMYSRLLEQGRITTQPASKPASEPSSRP